MNRRSERPERPGSKIALEETEKRRKRTCRFCDNPQLVIDYKDEKLLRRFISDRGKIVPRRISGNCARHQRRVSEAIKRGRHLALLPFTAEIYR